jgi:flagellar biosynthesis anti-sigma factor FlgM
VTTINDGGNDRQRIQDLSGLVRPQRPSRVTENGAGTPKPGSTSSSVHLSARAEQFMSLRERLSGLDLGSPERTARVDRLRQLVASGQYAPDYRAVASAMLDDPATTAALGL